MALEGTRTASPVQGTERAKHHPKNTADWGLKPGAGKDGEGGAEIFPERSVHVALILS